MFLSISSPSKLNCALSRDSRHMYFQTGFDTESLSENVNNRLSGHRCAFFGSSDQSAEKTLVCALAEQLGSSTVCYPTQISHRESLRGKAPAEDQFRDRGLQNVICTAHLLLRNDKKAPDPRQILEGYRGTTNIDELMLCFRTVSAWSHAQNLVCFKGEKARMRQVGNSL